jgi:hypothetical protein
MAKEDYRTLFAAKNRYGLAKEFVRKLSIEWAHAGERFSQLVLGRTILRMAV